MGMSKGALFGVLFSMIILHAGGALFFWRYLKQNASGAPKLSVSELAQSRIRWAILCLLLLSWIFSIIAAASCTFLTVSVPNQWRNPKENIEFGMGFAKFLIPLELASILGQDGSCENYNNPDLALLGFGSPSAANAFAIFNTLLTTLAVFMIFLVQCKLTKGRKRVWLAMRIFIYISMWCCLLSLYIQEADVCDVYICSWGTAAIIQIINIFILVIIFALLMIANHGETPGIQSVNMHRSAEDALEKNHFTKREDEAENWEEAKYIPGSKRMSKSNIET